VIQGRRGRAVVDAIIQYYSPYSTPSDGTAGPSQHPQGHAILSEVRAKKRAFHFLVQKWVSRQRLYRRKDDLHSVHTAQ
jgi:hypothetical protein